MIKIYLEFLDSEISESEITLTLSEVPNKGDILDLDIGFFKVIKIVRKYIKISGNFISGEFVETKNKKYYLENYITVYVEPEKQT
jgi:hypothetical protein